MVRFLCKGQLPSAACSGLPQCSCAHEGLQLQLQPGFHQQAFKQAFRTTPALPGNLSSTQHSSNQGCCSIQNAAMLAEVRHAAQQVVSLPFASITNASTGAANSRTAQALTAAPQDSATIGSKAWLQEQLLKLPFMEGVRAARERHAPSNATAAHTTSTVQALQGAAAATAAVVRSQTPDAATAAAISQTVTAAVSAATGSGTEAAQHAQHKHRVRPPPMRLNKADKQLWEAFSAMDVNGDNMIDFVELRTALEQLGLPCTPGYLLAMMREYDLNQDNMIDFDEFRFYVHKRENEIAKAFKAFDIDGNGQISASELGKVLQEAGVPADAQEVQRMMDKVDTDSDRTISYEEFRRFAAFMPNSPQIASNPALYAAWWRASSNAPATAALAVGPGAMNSTSNSGHYLSALAAAALADTRGAGGVGTHIHRGSSTILQGPHQGPFKHFVFFDIVMRSTLSVALLVIVGSSLDLM